MDCPECVRLTAEHTRSRLAYAAAVELLFATGYQLTDAEYGKLRESTLESRLESQTALLELEKHTLSHSTANAERSASAS